MLQLLFQNPLAFFIVFPGLLLSITLHEFAHCWVTDKLGDPTPRALGRLTLNPKAHLDPLGTLAILVSSFGWGKPAPYDPYNLKEPVRDAALIAAAGPASNLIIATVMSLGINFWTGAPALAVVIMFSLLSINVILAVFNLIPIYPLDGSRILTALLPQASALEYEQFMHRYGTMVLLFLIVPWSGGVAPVSQILNPAIDWVLSILL